MRDGEVAFYRDGAWHPAPWAYRRIMNGDGVGLVPRRKVRSVRARLDARDLVVGDARQGN